MKTVYYVGTSDSRSVSTSAFTALGVNDQTTVSWTPGQGQSVSDAAATLLTQSADFSLVAPTGAAPVTTARNPLVPVKVIKSDGDIVFQSNGAWADIDTGGAAAARPYDVVIPGVAAGQWIKFKPNFFIYNTGATLLYLDCFTIVGGAPINQMGTAAGGVSAWASPASTGTFPGIEVSYLVQAGDIEGGSVRLRMRGKSAAAVNRTLSAGALGLNMVLEGTGPFG